MQIELEIERDEKAIYAIAIFSQDIGDGTPEFIYAKDSETGKEIELTDGEEEKALGNAYEQKIQDEYAAAEYYFEDR